MYSTVQSLVFNEELETYDTVFSCGNLFLQM